MTGRRPEPVLTAAQVSALATWAAALLVSYLARHGWLLPEAVAEPLADLIEVGLVAAVGAVSALWGAVRARAKVTPLVDPVDADGAPLQPAARAPVQASAEREPNDEPDHAATVEMPALVDIAALRREYGL